MAPCPNGSAAGDLSKEERLDRALKSSLAELPENRPKGILGETRIDIRKTDDFAPDLNSGLSQENDLPVIWMAVVLGYLVFFIPGFVILWASKQVPIRTKIVASVVMGAGATCFVLLLLVRG